MVYLVLLGAERIAMNDALRDAIRSAHAGLPDDCRYAPATEKQLREFEAIFGPIPGDYRWYLAHCGGGVIGSEWVDGIDELPASHRKFRAECGPGGWSMRDVFVIGWDGRGNPFGIHRSTGKLLVEDHDFGGVHEVAESFEAFVIRGPLTMR